jgi:CheY-like chemotaxis protein
MLRQTGATWTGLGGNWNLPNILIVDDDPAVQITTSPLRERNGHRMTVAGDGCRDDLALREGSPFGLLFPDICIAGMDGPEVARRQT